MKARQFLNVVTQNYSLSRIKLKNNLFYPSTAEALQQAAMAATVVDKEKKQATHYDLLRIPPPKLTFKPSSRPSTTNLKLLPFYGAGGGGGQDSRVLCVDESGMSAIYDTEASTVEMMPGFGQSKGWDPISFSVTHSNPHDPARPNELYIMDNYGYGFEALIYGDPTPNPYQIAHRYAWHWRPLPPPPVARCNGEHCYVQSYALLHGLGGVSNSTICVSFSSFGGDRPGSAPRGTYCFDTGTGEWTKAGDWTLPFYSQAHHVPELDDGFMFGIESGHHGRFCAVDVSGIRENRAPVLHQAWVDIDRPPPEWSLDKVSVVYLGVGRFCIHSNFEIIAEFGWDLDTIGTVTLLTGVEVMRAESKLQMVKHKSKRLDFWIDSVL